MRRVFSILSILLCITFVAADDDMVDSAIYQSWNRHEIETSVTRNTKMNIGGTIVTTKQVSKLAVKDSNAVSIDEVITLNVMGKEQKQRSERYVSARVKKGREDMPESFNGTMTNTGMATLKIEGKAYECRVMEFTGTTPQGKATGTFWMNDDVPGLVVKAHLMTTSAQGDVDVEIMLESFELK